jgi:hypothetical protein
VSAIIDMKNPLSFFCVLVLSTLVMGSSRVWACSVCYGDPNSQMTQGLKMAVLALLMTVVVVLSLLLVAFTQMRKRSL